MKILTKLPLFWLIAMLVSACAAPATPTVVIPTATMAPTHDVAATAAAESNRQATAVAATLAALPTATLPPTPTETLAPTVTAVPATATIAPTVTQVPPTKVPATKEVVNTPAATAVPPTKESSSTGSIYSGTGGGPAGYTSTLYCSQVDGSPCQSTMAPGDLSFAITLQSTADALEVIFYPFGLSVERDGVNAADMYVTADAGWLPPGSQARFGVSRKFSVPGHYVVRTNGCLYTQANWASGVCSWWTLNGTVVTFDIQ